MKTGNPDSLTHNDEYACYQRQDCHKGRQTGEAEVHECNQPGKNQPDTQKERSQTVYLHPHSLPVSFA